MACLRKADHVTRQWEWKADGDHEIQRVSGVGSAGAQGQFLTLHLFISE